MTSGVQMDPVLNSNPLNNPTLGAKTEKPEEIGEQLDAVKEQAPPTQGEDRESKWVEKLIGLD